MTTATPPQADRRLFFDSARYALVLVVVAFHVSAGFCGYPEFYQEPEGGGAFQVVRDAVNFIPTMQLLFFIAGYFALSSLRQHGTNGFVVRKARQLGLPWLICVLFLAPFMPYLGYYSQSFCGLDGDNYGRFWAEFLGSGFRSWYTHASFTTHPQFHHMHYWFLSVLLQLFLLLAVLRAAWSRWGHRWPRRWAQWPEPASDAGALLLGVLAVTVLRWVGGWLPLPYGTLAFVFNDFGHSWFEQGAFFALGVYASWRGWYDTRPLRGWVPFGVLSGALAGVVGLAVGLYTLWGQNIPDWAGQYLGPLFDTVRVMWCLTIVMGLCQRFLNRPGPMAGFLARHSFNVYLVHYPLILVFRLVLLPWPAPTAVKWVLTLVWALVASHALSHWLVRPRPRLAVGLLLLANVAVAVVGLPRTAWSHLLIDRRPELAQAIGVQAPQSMLEPPTSNVDGYSEATPSVRASWQAGSLYVAHRPRGLYLLTAPGTRVSLSDTLELSWVAPLADGSLAAVEPSSRRLLRLDGRGRVTAVLVDSTDSTCVPLQAVADGRGGVFVAARPRTEGAGSIWYRTPGGALRRAAGPDSAWTQPLSLALAPDGTRLYIAVAERAHVYTADIADDGTVSPSRPFAELFLGNARYGRADLGRLNPQVEAMTTDRDGRLYVATHLGVQVFDRQGQLLGVVTVPGQGVDYQRSRPLSCVFGGPGLTTLYITCGERVWALPTRTGGVVFPGS